MNEPGAGANHAQPIGSLRAAVLALLYLGLSLLDIWLTWRLVGDNSAGEANPLAARILASTGWTGLIVFKLACVTLVLGIVRFLLSRRPRVAYRLLGLACSITFMVVGYAFLFGQPLRSCESRTCTIDPERCRVYSHRAGELARRIVEERLDLDQAMRELEAFGRNLQLEPGRYFEQHFRGLSADACAAAYLIYCVGYHLTEEDAELARWHLAGLSEHYAALFGMTLPEYACFYFPSSGP